MATINWQVQKKTFNPEKNYFEIDYVKISREESDQEIKFDEERYKWERAGFMSLIIGFLGGFIVAITFGALGSAINPWFYIGTAVGGLMIVMGIFLPHGWFWEKEKELAYAYQDWYKAHEEELWAEAMKEVNAYNEEQEHIAEAWRAEHPFEEHIRTCIKDPNSSVAIAVAAKYYAENYLNKEN